MATARSAGVLGAAGGWVKRASPGRIGHAWLVWLVAAAACGGKQAPPPERDPYAQRVARCFASPRPASDAAQNAMLSVTGGETVIGSTPQERALAVQLSGAGSQKTFEGEQARHIETVSAFRIDRTPITNRAYAEFVASCGKVPPDTEAITPELWAELATTLGVSFTYEQVARFIWPGVAPYVEREDHPVVLVSYEDAAFYCAWRGARLPTELEWERAARGTQGQLFPWGNGFDPSMTGTRESGNGDTTAVASIDLATSPSGAKDMGGLVFEWTTSPFSPAHASEGRVVKGNSWNRLGGQSRGAARTARVETLRDIEVGFRCAR